MKYVIAVALSFLAVYLAESFILWELNAAKWDGFARFAVILWGCCLSVISSIVVGTRPFP